MEKGSRLQSEEVKGGDGKCHTSRDGACKGRLLNNKNFIDEQINGLGCH